MGYTADRSLADAWPEDFVEVVAEDIAANVQDRFFTDAKRLTPVAQIPEAYQGDFPSWEEDRGGRLPGTLKEAWVKLPIERSSDGFSATIENPDPIASHVEHDTQPHMIFVKKARALRFPSGPVFRYAPYVFHPGTQGKHMLRDAEMGIDVLWPEIAQRTIDLHSLQS